MLQMNVEEKSLFKLQQVHIIREIATVKSNGATDNMENLIVVEEIIRRWI